MDARKLAAAAFLKPELETSDYYDMRKDVICAHIKKHVDARTPVSSFNELYAAVSASIEKETGFAVPPNGVEKAYNKWRVESGVDERTYVTSVSRLLLVER